MEKHFALIKNNLVEGVIVADKDFLKHIEKNYDFIIEVTNEKRPSPGDSYYPETRSFICNHTVMNHIPIDSSELKGGTDNEFQPFYLSNYLVTYENGIVTIGCKKYTAAGLLDSCNKVLIERKNTTSHFTTVGGEPAHGKFPISWEDAKKLHEALKKLKL